MLYAMILYRMCNCCIVLLRVTCHHSIVAPSQSNTLLTYIPYGRKFWRGIYFGGLAVLRAIRQYFIRQIAAQCDVIIIAKSYQCVYTRPAARRASLIVGIEFTIKSCVRGHHFSKEVCTPEVGEGLACLSRRRRRSKRRVRGPVKTDGTKIVQSKRNSDLLSFQLHFIINFVLTEPKLTHGPIKIPARLSSHFVMNIIIAKPGSTAKVNSAK